MVESIPLQRGLPLVDENLMPTRRTSEYLEGLSKTTNTTTTVINQTTLDYAARSLIFDIQQQLGSGDGLTWDETGFSWDSTDFTFDQTEA